MLVRLAEHLATRSINSQDELTVMENNALIECFAVHARALADFLGLRPHRDDDVHASHFFRSAEDWENLWKEDNKKWTSIEDQIAIIRNRVNKEVVHITRIRMDVTTNAKEWNPDNVVTLLSHRLRTFAGNADKLPEQIKTFIMEVSSRETIPRSAGVVSTTLSGSFIRPL
jgi:hypothetical protein